MGVYLNEQEVIDKLISLETPLDKITVQGDHQNLWLRFINKCSLFGLPRERLHIISNEYVDESKPKSAILFDGQLIDVDDGNDFGLGMFFDRGHQFITAPMAPDHTIFSDTFIFAMHECAHHLYARGMEARLNIPVTEYPNFALDHNTRSAKFGSIREDLLDLKKGSYDIESEVVDLQLFLMVALNLIYKNEHKTHIDIPNFIDVLAGGVEDDYKAMFKSGRNVYLRDNLGQFLPKKIDERCLERRCY